MTNDDGSPLNGASADLKSLLVALANSIQSGDGDLAKLRLETVAPIFDGSLQEVHDWLNGERLIGKGSRLAALQAVNCLRLSLAAEDAARDRDLDTPVVL
jgi:hypothetical protein